MLQGVFLQEGAAAVAQEERPVCRAAAAGGASHEGRPREQQAERPDEQHASGHGTEPRQQLNGAEDSGDEELVPELVAGQARGPHQAAHGLLEVGD